MILTVTKYHENLLKVSSLSLLSMVKFLSSLETKIVLKIPNETFLRITRYKDCVHDGAEMKKRGGRGGKSRYNGLFPKFKHPLSTVDHSNEKERKRNRVDSQNIWNVS